MSDNPELVDYVDFLIDMYDILEEDNVQKLLSYIQDSSLIEEILIHLQQIRHKLLSKEGINIMACLNEQNSALNKNILLLRFLVHPPYKYTEIITILSKDPTMLIELAKNKEEKEKIYMYDKNMYGILSNRLKVRLNAARKNLKECLENKGINILEN